MYLSALDLEMLFALRFGSATLVPDLLLPIEAYLVVPFVISVSLVSWIGAIRVLRSSGGSKGPRVDHSPVGSHESEGSIPSPPSRAWNEEFLEAFHKH